MKKWLIALTSLLSITSSTTISITNNNSAIQKVHDININVNISSYDENNVMLTSFQYQPKLESSLSDLMAQDKNTYLLKDFGASLGLYLYGVNYYDAEGKKQTKLEIPNSTYWAFWYMNDEGEEEMSPVGISSYYLTKANESIIWRYTKIN